MLNAYRRNEILGYAALLNYKTFVKVMKSLFLLLGYIKLRLRQLSQISEPALVVGVCSRPFSRADLMPTFFVR